MDGSLSVHPLQDPYSCFYQHFPKPTGLKVSDREQHLFTTTTKSGRFFPTQKIVRKVKILAQHFSEVADYWLLGCI